MKAKQQIKSDNNLLIGIIGDEETVTGFLLAGIGQRSENNKNYFIVTKEDSYQIGVMFDSLVSRSDIGVILICQHIAKEIKEKIEEHDLIVPTILEIPSKNHPYNIEDDTIMQRALIQLYGSSKLG